MNQRASHAKVRRARLIVVLVVALVVALRRRRIGGRVVPNKRLEKVSKIKISVQLLFVGYFRRNLSWTNLQEKLHHFE